MKTEIILVPNSTEASTPMLASMDLSSHYKQILPEIQGVLAESLAGGRKWLKKLQMQLPVLALDHTKADQLRFDLEKIKGQTWVYVTDAGYPCIADPGSVIVKMAREMNYKVHLLPGTSAIVAAIALSGLSSQRFSFHGYLPREESSLKAALLDLERSSYPKDESWQKGALQVFIEVPHRYTVMLRTCIQTLDDKTWLAVAREVGNEGQSIEVKTISAWKRELKDLDEKKSEVAVFLLINEEKKAPSKATFEKGTSKILVKNQIKTQAKYPSSSKAKRFFN